MACFQIAGSGFSPAVTLRPGLLNRRFAAPAAFIRCRGEESDRGFGGEEAPESLFMKELKRRGMTPTSLLEEGKTGAYELGEKEMEEAIEEDVVSTGRKKKRNGVVLDDKGVVNQQKVSMALNSEGLEGLIPRAKLLLTLGGTFFLAFWPLILVTVATFAALYLYFGPSFVHNASKMSISPPPYVDPYALLEDERISQTAPKMS